ncbi:MFS transporter [Agrococcus sp. HG114]|uniref:MFS transporter n=1 Tax=Agrococcus sp. HG114 TaxID=2969757 RepID=UPI00215A2C4A|nr:MFS transporter [Agrococcus sp. HG114]MCR8669554.1 MFS transporter [Agrococcus sp. HG114]
MPKHERRHLLALSWGHALEWFDWAMFGLLSVYIGAAFFPADSVLASTLNALAVFAVGFIARPIGGVVFGFMADRIGRKRIMIGAIAAVAGASLVIGVLPDFETIGYLAPITVVVMRLLQGLSAGIEAPLGTAYALELVRERPGYVAGYFAFFNNFGNLLAPLSAFFITLALGPELMGEWGWRVPFIIGGLLGLVVLYLRRTLPETLHTTAIKAGEAADPIEQANPAVWSTVRKHWLSVVAIVFIVGAMQSFMYAFLSGLPNLANGAFEEDPTGVFAVTTGLGIFLTLGALVLAKTLDKIKLSRWFIGARLLTIPAIFLILLYSGPGLGTFGLVMAVGGVLILLNGTVFVVVANSMLPQHVRGTGVGLGYGIGVALFGGTASYILVWLQSQGAYWLFPTYVALLCALSVVFYILAKRKHGVYVGR